MLILHLSDLHFGAHSRFRELEPAVFAEGFLAQLEASRKGLGIDSKVELVIATGDFAETGHPREFEQAGAFLGAVVDGLGQPRRRTVLLPGNHDVSWLLCKKAEIDQQLEGFDDVELRSRFEDMKFHPYQDFTAQFYGEAGVAGVATSLRSGALLYRYPEQRLAVAALNSCERESHRREDHVGLIGRDQAKSVMDTLRTPDAVSWLKILAVHHNPDVNVPANLDSWKDRLRSELAAGAEVDELIARYESDALGFEGRERLKAIAEDCGVQLVLHGHHHARDDKAWNGGRSHVLSAGSLALAADKLPRDEPASVRLIEIDTDTPEIRSWCLTYAPQARIEGQVDRGAFTPDQAEPEGRSFVLTLPPLFLLPPAVRPSPASPAEAGASSWFLDGYRRAFRHQFLRWDLSMLGVATRPAGSSPEFAADLDEMYQALRLAPGFDVSRIDLGAPLPPEELLARDRPLIIRGLAGSGKTTWVRWTFRRLIERPDALPLTLVLRELAPQWQRGRGAKRRLTRFLADKISERVEGDCETELRRALQATSGPRPLLLVDGWDELGQLGDQVREGLQALREEYPRLLVVVTSRPFGEGRPSHAEGFETLDLQPLSDQEMALLATRFFRRCHGEDVDTAATETAQFQSALERSRVARELGRTPLLLTMMLFLSRIQRLPDNRHLLYDACIDNLLTHLPERKAEEGALDAHGHWWPPDSEERRQAVAGLAWSLQSEGYRHQTRSAIRAREEQLMELLPANWQPAQRRGFLAWLVARSGLLTDHADGLIEFSHLSFQEYLTAWHLDVNERTREAQKRRMSGLLGDADWWETLCLWAAILSGRSRQQLEPLLAALMRAGGAAQGLAGTMFADGLGSDERFSTWSAAFAATLAREWPANVGPCLYAWAASQQNTRREELGRHLAEQGPGVSWLGWTRLRDAAGVAGLQAPTEPAAGSLAGLILGYLRGAAVEASSLAAGRFLCGGFPLWPGDPPETSLLNLWPGERRIAGMRLQALACSGVAEATVRAAARAILAPPKLKAETLSAAREWAREWTRDWARHWARDWARDLARHWARDWARYLARYLARHWGRRWTRDWACDWTRDLARYWARDWPPGWARDLARDWAGDWARDWARDLARAWTGDWTRDLARYGARDLARYWVRSLKLDPDQPGILDSAAIESLSPSGWAGGRAFVAQLRTVPQEPLIRFYAAACRLSLEPTSDGNAEAFEAALAEAERQHLDPLWQALGRHLARRPDAPDRSLLVERVANAHEDDSPLGWGLRYIVRGDILLAGGRVITLDELSDLHGLPRLPLLEEMPDELDVGWEEEPAET